MTILSKNEESRIVEGHGGIYIQDCRGVVIQFLDELPCPDCRTRGFNGTTRHFHDGWNEQTSAECERCNGRGYINRD